MLRNNINPLGANNTIKTEHKENAQFYQLLNTTRKKIAHDHSSALNEHASICRSTTFNATQELDSKKISASNNHSDLCNNSLSTSYKISSKHFKTLKMPLGKNIQDKLQLFESMKQKSADIVTKQENLQPQNVELDCIANKTQQSKLNDDVMKELHKIRCQKSYTPLIPMPKLLSVNELTQEKSKTTNSTDTLSASNFHPIEEMSSYLSSTTSDGLEVSNRNSLPTGLLESIDEFNNICSQFDSVSEPIVTNYDQDVIGVSS